MESDGDVKLFIFQILERRVKMLSNLSWMFIFGSNWWWLYNWVRNLSEEEWKLCFVSSNFIRIIDFGNKKKRQNHASEELSKWMKKSCE